jgi:DNA (cytosine-5)-methyltransferase 1
MKRVGKNREGSSARCVSIRAVDLFCGVGGLTHGLEQAGVDVTAGIDLDPHCRYPYETNNEAQFVQKDIRSLEAAELQKFFKDAPIRLLAGCAPCQPFSTYSQSKRGVGAAKDWSLLLEFGRLVCQLQPELVTMENVPQLLNNQVFSKFLESLNGYHLWYGVVECIEYGIPQTRKRLVLLGSRLGPVQLIKPTHSKKRRPTVRDVIGHLPPLEAGQADNTDPMHSACSLTPINVKRVKASSPGGSWRDWPKELRLGCHSRPSGQTYPSVYGRMSWDQPAPTMTTQCFGLGNGRFGHPEQDRAISLREAALFQTFPREYEFLQGGERATFSVMGRLIGNAVPVRLGEVVAASLVRHVREHHLISSETRIH